MDTSVLLDVLGADREFGERSRSALGLAYDAGALVASDVVWAEVRARFPDSESFHAALSILGVELEPMSQNAAEAAGAVWRSYCLGSPRPRKRVVADILIGAHALLQADRLLARDRGYYREIFDRLNVIDPGMET